MIDLRSYSVFGTSSSGITARDKGYYHMIEFDSSCKRRTTLKMFLLTLIHQVNCFMFIILSFMWYLMTMTSHNILGPSKLVERCLFKCHIRLVKMNRQRRRPKVRKTFYIQKSIKITLDGENKKLDAFLNTQVNFS